MEVGLLGLFEVVVEGRRVPIGQGKESALLARLALEPNCPVAVDRLIGDLWGRTVPTTASKNVHVYVSRIRRAIGGDLVETTPGGYLLRLADDAIDARRFRRLALEARAALASGETALAETVLSDALRLWRGDALADFRYETWAQEDIRSLGEARREAIADRVDARLALGRAAEVVPELEALIADSPTWERPRGQLMLALYRCGRQAEALETYRKMRVALGEELGLEPGAALRELEQQILNQDPVLGASRIATARISRRRRPLAMLVASCVLLTGLAIAAVSLLGGGGRATAFAPVPPDSLAVVDPASNAVIAEIPIGSGPSSVAVGGDSVWVANAGDQTLVRVDAATKTVLERIGLGSIPGQVAAAAATVWVTTSGPAGGALLQVDPASQAVVRRSIPGSNNDLFAPAAPNALVTVGDGAWTNTFHSQLARVPVGARPVLRRLGLAHSADGIAFGAGSLWVSSSADDSVLRVDPRSGMILAQIPIAAVSGRRVAGPYGIAYGAGSVWVAAALEDRIVRIDPHTNAIVTTIRVGPRPTSVVVGGGAVWALDAGDGTLSRIDPAGSRVVASIRIAQDVTGIAAGAGAVWVTVAGAPRELPVAARHAAVLPLPASSCGPVWRRSGTPNLLVVSDLPTFPGGPGAPADPIVTDMRRAILGVLQQRGFRAGRFRIAYQACNDGSRRAGVTPQQCALNGRMLAANGSVGAVIGPYTSSCAKIELPILDTARNGPIATISPATTYVGLTHSGPSTSVDEPNRYYPGGVRNFVRLVGADDAQGAALAQLASRLGVHRMYLLDDGNPTGEATAEYVATAAQRLGVRVVGMRNWALAVPVAALRRHFHELAATVATTRPDAVVLTGCGCSDGIPLAIEIRHALGPHIPLIGSDNFMFTTDMASRGPTEMLGMYLTSAGAAPASLGPQDRRFLAQVFPGRSLLDIGSDVPLAADATRAVLDAIARSTGTPASINSLLSRSALFDERGDPVRQPVTVVRIAANAPPEYHLDVQGLLVDRVIDARPRLTAPR